MLGSPRAKIAMEVPHQSFRGRNDLIYLSNTDQSNPKESHKFEARMSHGSECSKQNCQRNIVKNRQLLE